MKDRLSSMPKYGQDEAMCGKQVVRMSIYYVFIYTENRKSQPPLLR